ncbi:UDP-N-acetylglucosamine 2-epimerase (hydrolyzing) [Idiomarina loihiensis]|uniref:UDP-N-acetylglucosamine 2-epimerase n=1 Tax=Idiomarina loihiensis TaxID=135577 RepID=UPI00129D214E|nr:UDP-N-acetylglucosamine 2-epimerase [Idiomarina loihiensis]MRJ45164.1 UDP-N-acetylglucosamine 2-epimerase (hydrolyzing) [Idiomarina loihiensis]UTW32136.1 UDP-N-acetylglucosamine 2-epimerase (hydrolyzing) [Idiomarina loihiensis]
MRAKKVAVFTGTRAEYGLLYWLLKDIQHADDLTLQLLVSGSHLSPEFGHTIDQITADGFDIAEKVEMLLSSDSAVGTVKSLGLGIIGYADALTRLQPDMLVLLGDRYEALGVAQAAMLMRIPVLHIHGGEITEGAYDDALRHAITKLSLLHATSTDVYRQRVIQLGESPERVVNVGAIGLDHLKRSEFMSRDELSNSLGFPLDSNFAVMTYHPVTLANEPAEETFVNITQALDAHPDLQVIMTYPNADEGGRKIIPLIEAYAAKNKDRVLAIQSLGQKRYLSAVKQAAVVIGNSSSGIIEVPSFNVPTVNIGDRQLGRLAADSVIHCAATKDSIQNALAEALKQVKSGALSSVVNPYGKGNAGEEILSLIRRAELTGVKTFHDLDPERGQ